MQIDSQVPIKTLLGNILELKNGISEIQDYVSPDEDAEPLPLGIMGQIMAQQLQAESGVLAYHAQLLQTKHTDGWELARHSSALENKVGVLITLAGMIAQLPSYNLQAHVIIVKLTERVIEKCKRIENALQAITTKAVVVSSPNYVNA